MLRPRDVDIIRRELEKSLASENSLADRLEITFYSMVRTASGGDVARHYDNSPLDAWADDDGFTETDYFYTVPCTYVPKVEAVNLVQEGYHPDSEVEVFILNRDLEASDISINDLQNTFEYAKMEAPHKVDMRGRASESITKVWSILSVRPMTVSKQLIGITVGLALREHDSTKPGIEDL